MQLSALLANKPSHLPQTKSANPLSRIPRHRQRSSAALAVDYAFRNSKNIPQTIVVRLIDRWSLNMLENIQIFTFPAWSKELFCFKKPSAALRWVTSFEYLKRWVPPLDCYFGTLFVRFHHPDCVCNSLQPDVLSRQRPDELCNWAPTISREIPGSAIHAISATVIFDLFWSHNRSSCHCEVSTSRLSSTLTRSTSSAAREPHDSEPYRHYRSRYY